MVYSKLAELVPAKKVELSGGLGCATSSLPSPDPRISLSERGPFTHQGIRPAGHRQNDDIISVIRESALQSRSLSASVWPLSWGAAGGQSKKEKRSVGEYRMIRT